MILGYPALVLHLLTILALGVFTGTVIASVIARLTARRLPHFSLKSRQNILRLFAFFPFIAGVAAILLSFLPEWLPVSDLWLTGIIHWHHAYLFSPASWHGVFLLLCLVSLLAVLFLGAYRGMWAVRRERLLGHFSQPRKAGLSELDTQVPMAFVTGLWQPRAFITRGLSTQINEHERQIICLHEQAHIAHRDPLRKFFFMILVCQYPARVRGFLQVEFELVLEQLADEWVMGRYPQPAAIAQSLLKVERLAARFDQSSDSDLAQCHFVRHAVERRVHHLLGVSQYRSLPRLAAGLMIMMAILCSAAGVDLLHHSFETLFLH